MTSPVLTPVKDQLHDSLIEHLTEIRSGMLALGRKYSATLSTLPQTHQTSARNLVHYLALRRRDLRTLQQSLASLGLSSLGRTESHVLSGVESVLRLLYRLKGTEWKPTEVIKPALTLPEGKAALKEHT